MGKKTDRMYITCSEYTSDFGGKKAVISKNPFTPLAFSNCCLSFQPFEDPVLTPDGYVYDIVNIVPFIQAYKVEPMTGNPLTVKDIIKLHFYKNAKGEYHCPVTFKEFTDHSHIVAIKTSGNVYAFDAVDELNIKQKIWYDLVTGEHFTKSDIVTLQDPLNLEKRIVANAWHLKQNFKDEEDDDPLKNIRANSTTVRSLQELYTQREAKEKEEQGEKEVVKPEPIYTAESFTSTSAPLVTKNIISVDNNQKRPKKKGICSNSYKFR